MAIQSVQRSRRPDQLDRHLRNIRVSATYSDKNLSGAPKKSLMTHSQCQKEKIILKNGRTKKNVFDGRMRQP